MRTSPDRLNGLQSGALIVAHPSHETRLHGWLEAASPRVYILTDGSGLSGNPTIASAAAYVDQIVPGSIMNA